MPDIKELRNHIRNIKNTQKVTNAMFLISSTRLKAGKSRLQSASVYSRQLEELISDTAGDMGSSVFVKGNTASGSALLVIGAEKGLNGDFGKEIFKALTDIYNGEEMTVFALGSRLRHTLDSNKIDYDRQFDYSVKNPEFKTAQEIADFLTDRYTDGRFGSVSVIYSDVRKGIVTEKLLPLSSQGGAGKKDYEFVPLKEKVFKSLMPLYIVEKIYYYLLSTYCSEHNARIIAMQAANENAKTLIDELSLQYNRLRQNAITREISEISGERKQK